MLISKKVSLKLYSTMRLGGDAKYLTTVENASELIQAIEYAESKKLKYRVIGGGSNILWSDEGFDGLVIVNQIKGFKKDKNLLTFGAGVNWDKAVEASLASGLYGLENLSAIPGTVGATPIQNVGAYGVEVSEVIEYVTVYDTKDKQVKNLSNEECAFSHRSSTFKRALKPRYVILSVCFKLSDKPNIKAHYHTLTDYLKAHKIVDRSPQTIRDAVISIRASKLPDPKITANLGSFFENPLVDKERLDKMLKKFPDLKYFKYDDTRFKISAGWMIESLGLKGLHDEKTGMQINPDQALVLINRSAKKTKDLLEFRDMIIAKVKKKYGITIKQEPDLI